MSQQRDRGIQGLIVARMEYLIILECFGVQDTENEQIRNLKIIPKESEREREAKKNTV
jgi:hypothetical protein